MGRYMPEDAEAFASEDGFDRAVGAISKDTGSGRDRAGAKATPKDPDFALRTILDGIAEEPLPPEIRAMLRALRSRQ